METATKKSKKTRGAANKNSNGAGFAATPIFLRKTYEMIDTCDKEDPSIASWSDNGTSFVVKDKKRFETQIIPQYFNHNKLSSFVRQLNMYGFRKIKFDPIRLTDVSEFSNEAEYSKFAHDKFQKDRLDLVAQIRKTSHNNEGVDKEEVESLKAEIKSLKRTLTNTKNEFAVFKQATQHEIAELRALVVGSLVAQEKLGGTSTTTQPLCFPDKVASKKRKVDDEHALPTPVLSDEPSASSQPEVLTPLPVLSETLEESVDATGNKAPPLSSVATVKALPLERCESTQSSGTLDSDILEMLQNLEEHGDDDDISMLDNVAMPDGVFSTANNEQVTTDGNATAVDPELVEKLRNALSNLPPEMQKLFVDRIVQAIGNPEGLKIQVDAMTSLALAAAEEARRRLVVAGRDPNDEQFCIPLATAVLGAYLARFTTTEKGGKIVTSLPSSNDDVVAAEAPQHYAI